MKKYLLILLLLLFNSCQQNGNSIFLNFQQKLSFVTDSTDRQVCADRFLQKLSNKDYPIFENDSTVVLLYKKSAKKVEMIGDVNFWTDPSKFSKIDGTDLHYLRQKIEKNSLLEYWLIIDGEKIQVDSLNQYQVKNEFGYASQIVNHTNPFYLDQLKNKDKQLYKTYLVPLQNNQFVKIHIYFPSEYNDYDFFPLAIFLDGKKYIELGDAPIIIDNLIKAGKIEKTVAVFAEIGFEEDDDDPTTEMYSKLSNIITNNILTFVESRFNIANNPEKRVLIGKSISGGLNLITVFDNPDKFGNLFIQSGYLSADNFALKDYVVQNYKRNLNCYFQIGIYERNVSHMIIPPSETDFYQINKDFVELLDSKGYKVKLDEFVAGHTWGNWKNHLADGLIYFFGIDE